METNTEVAIFAAGCFWGVEERFRQLEGVIKTRVGYTGGTTQNPTYEEVCSGTTEHAEALRITFDPEQIDFAALLGHFWDCHDPTTLNRQGPNLGAQYRSAIFYTSEAQHALATNGKAGIPGAVTQIAPATTFYDAEEYHQLYIAKKQGLI